MSLSQQDYIDISKKLQSGLTQAEQNKILKILENNVEDVSYEIQGDIRVRIKAKNENEAYEKYHDLEGHIEKQNDTEVVEFTSHYAERTF